HADHGDERGWRNPFGYVDTTVSDLLERQRHKMGDSRTATVRQLLSRVTRQSPMTVLARPNRIHAVRSDRIAGWPSGGLQTSDDLLGLYPADGESLDTVRIAITDARVTRNQNPLAFAFRNQGLVTGLLYEPLGRWLSSGLETRLAREWQWSDDEGDDRLSVSLEDAIWHDGTPVTAADVAFTYRFVADTSLGSMDEPVPAPMFRGRSELVEDVTVTDDRTVSIEFDASPEVARRALTLPILPEHVWRKRTNPAAVARLSIFDASTEALRWSNPEPIGSGPLEFESAEDDQSLRLTRFDDHFAGHPAFERLTFRVAPSDAAAIELVLADEVDAAGPIASTHVSNIAQSDEATMIAGVDRSFYHVGFNAREPPLDDVAFRRAIGFLVDRRDVVDRIFEGFASATAIPVDDRWLPEDAVEAGSGPTDAFPASPGELDREAALAAFREAGYNVDADGAMISAE
ncbi:MAG: ABC transporter substrate-binding protein, partial [Halanaeroarchaeum sp.]